jgi:FAD/FMN-containing dehydrogenase
VGERNPDLFWAVRGGGGNFGIVTSFLFRLHPVRTVHAGPMLRHVDQAAEALVFYRDCMANAPDEISGFFAFMTVPPAPPFPQHLHGKKMCGVVWCYTGPEEGVEETFRSVRRFGPPVVDFVHAMPFPTLQAMFDASAPPGMQQYWRADFFDDLSDASVALHVKYGSKTPTPHSISHIYPLDGVVQRVGRDETAFRYRDAKWAVVIVGADPDPANNERIIQWTKDYWLALHPHSVGGAYVNFLMDEGSDRARAAYRNNYPRLVAVKTKYDPGNFFRINHNIAPSGSRE